MVPTSWDGSSLEIQLLRPREWLVAAGAFLGSTIHLDLEEMGAHGPALVQNITSAPEIASGDGEVVTGTFRHSSGNVIQLYVAGLVEPIGTTSNHPFWSHDRQQFVPAGELIVGENLRTEDGRTIAVTASVVQDEELSVCNLEVNTEHVYYVSKDALLVHNSYAPNRVGSGVPTNIGPVSSKGLKRVTPGIRELEGHHVNGLGRVEPWRYHYDEFGRRIGRTDYNAGNIVDGIPDTHYHRWEYTPEFPNGIEIQSHIPGEFPL